LVAYRLLERGGVLLHSAAVVSGGSACVCIGRSGHGKSTVSGIALEAGRRVLSDDLNALLIEGGGVHAAWLPFHGDVASPFAPPSSYPVKALYLLEKASAHHLRAANPGRLIAALTGAAPYVNRDPHRSELLLCHLQRICSLIPGYHFQFRPDRGLLDLLCMPGSQ
jgi:hypothetical protein